MGDVNTIWGDVRGWVHRSSERDLGRLDELDEILGRSGVPVLSVDGLADYLRPRLVAFAPGQDWPGVDVLLGRWLRGELVHVSEAILEDGAGSLVGASAHLALVEEHLSERLTPWNSFEFGAMPLESFEGVYAWAAELSLGSFIFLREGDERTMLEGEEASTMMEMLEMGCALELMVELPLEVSVMGVAPWRTDAARYVLNLTLEETECRVGYQYFEKDRLDVVGALELMAKVERAAPGFEPAFEPEWYDSESGPERSREVAAAWRSLWRAYTALRS